MSIKKNIDKLKEGHALVQQGQEAVQKAKQVAGKLGGGMSGTAGLIPGGGFTGGIGGHSGSDMSGAAGLIPGGGFAGGIGGRSGSGITSTGGLIQGGGFTGGKGLAERAA
ncbi:hypothetical protein ACR71G_17885, partial [Xenorhabdus bovienii]